MEIEISEKEIKANYGRCNFQDVSISIEDPFSKSNYINLNGIVLSFYNDRSEYTSHDGMSEMIIYSTICKILNKMFYHVDIDEKTNNRLPNINDLLNYDANDYVGINYDDIDILEVNGEQGKNILGYSFQRSVHPSTSGNF